MAANPYAGTVFQDTWQSGFSDGSSSPDADHAPPSVLVVDQQTVYREGVLAGQDSARGGDASAAQTTGWVTAIKEAGIEIAEFSAHVAFDLATVKDATFAMSSATSALLVFAKVAIWGPERAPFFEEAAAQAVAGILAELQSQGRTTSSNVELFMAACDQSFHGTDTADALRAQGWWHGRVLLNFDAALAEAAAHGDHPERVRVLRFQSAAPDTVDVIQP